MKTPVMTCTCSACVTQRTWIARLLDVGAHQDRSDGERFITRESNKRWLDEIPVAKVIKEKVDLVHKYPGASEGIFAVY